MGPIVVHLPFPARENGNGLESSWQPHGPNNSIHKLLNRHDMQETIRNIQAPCADIEYIQNHLVRILKDPATSWPNTPANETAFPASLEGLGAPKRWTSWASWALGSFWKGCPNSESASTPGPGRPARPARASLKSGGVSAKSRPWWPWWPPWPWGPWWLWWPRPCWLAGFTPSFDTGPVGGTARSRPKRFMVMRQCSVGTSASSWA